MAKRGANERGIAERKETCRTCGGKCAACKGKKKTTCPACPCSTCKACKGTGQTGTGEWWVDFWDHGVRHREKGGTKTAARDLYNKRRAAIREGKFYPDMVGRRKRPRLSEAIDAYLLESESVKRSWRDDARYGSLWKRELGNRFLDEVTPADVEAWRRKKAADDGVTPATVNRHVAFLRRVFNVAIRDQKCDQNPAAGSRVRKLVENNERTRHVSEEEEGSLRDALPPRWWRFVALLILTGLRMGEFLGLRWERIDFAAGVITIPRTKHGELRHIPLSEDVRALFLEEPSRGQSPWVFPSKTQPAKHMPYSTFRNHWLKALKKAKLDDTDLKPHDLRHSFASRLVMDGVDLRTVQELLGHKTIAMTQRYAHLSPQHLREAMGRVRLSSPKTPHEHPPQHPQA